MRPGGRSGDSGDGRGSRRATAQRDTVRRDVAWCACDRRQASCVLRWLISVKRVLSVERVRYGHVYGVRAALVLKQQLGDYNQEYSRDYACSLADWWSMLKHEVARTLP